MNAERFEERLMHELKNHVRQRDIQTAADHDHAPDAETVRRLDPRPRRRFAIVGLSVGISAVAAGVITAVVLTPSAAPNADHSLFRAANAAYAIQQEPSGIVKFTILDASGRPNVEDLRRDLADAGINARVVADVPSCPNLPAAPATPTPALIGRPLPLPTSHVPSVPPHASPPPDWVAHENGKLVYYLNTAAMPPGSLLDVMFGRDLGSLEIGPTNSVSLPTCIPVVPALRTGH